MTGVEEMQDAHFHGGPDGRQQYPDEERPHHLPLSPPHRRCGGGRGDGEAQHGSYSKVSEEITPLHVSITCVDVDLTVKVPTGILYPLHLGMCRYMYFQWIMLSFGCRRSIRIQICIFLWIVLNLDVIIFSL